MTTKVNLERPGPALTPEEIEAFEREIGGRLPDDYKQFMLAHNGGLVEPNVGLPWKGRIETVGGFNQLWPVTGGSVRRVLRDLRELSADGFLPIASTWNGQAICLAFREHVGAAFITVYTYVNQIPVAVTMAPLADSFTEFLDLLVEIPDPYCRVEDLGKQGTPDDLAQYLADGNSIDAAGKNDLTIICEAVKFDNLPMIEACIERGASLSETLHIAVGNDRVEFIEMLVEAGADINERNDFGRTPLFGVGGTELPGEEGTRNRGLRDLLIKLGAVM